MPRVSDEFLQKIADGRAGSRCDCPAYWQRRDEARELIAARVLERAAKLVIAMPETPPVARALLSEALGNIGEVTK